MHRTRLLPVLLLLLSSIGVAQSTKGAFEIEQLQVKREGSDVRIEVILTGAVQPAVETATNPDRLVLTLPGTLSDAKQKHFLLNANGVHGVRVGLNNANPPVTRVVVDMESALPYTVDTNGKSIVVHVQSGESAIASKHSGPVPAASAPLMSVFHKKPPDPPVADESAAQAPIPVPPKFPPINFPQKQPTTQADASMSPVITIPSATHPKLGSLQEGTVFPGMGTPGAGSVPSAQNQTATAQPATAQPAAQPLTVTVTQPSTSSAGAPVITTASNGTTPATPAVSTASNASAPKTSPSVQTPTSITAAASMAQVTTSPATPKATTTASLAPAPAATAPAATSAGSTPSSAGAPNVTAKVLSATVNTPSPAPAAPVATTSAAATPTSQPSQPVTAAVVPSTGAGNVASQPVPTAAAAPADATANETLNVTPEAVEATPEMPSPAEVPAALALRATHPDFRTTFKVKYVAEGVAYLDGGRSAGLTEGMKLVVRDTPTGSVASAADGNADNVVAELEVMSVADASAVTDIHTPKRDVKSGDLAYLSSQDEQALVQENTLSATRKYPTVISFTDADALDDEARAEVPRPPMPSINRARGRIGVDYMGTSFHGSTGGMTSNVGLVARLDMTRIGGTYWNANGYWRGNLNSSTYTGMSTVQDLINRTYHIGLTYDNPSSSLVAGVGRMYLPWAPSLDTIDGGYVGRRFGHLATVGIFGGSTPDPSSWSYNPNQRIAGAFVNFEGGSFDGLRYSSTTGGGVNMLGWNVTKPFVFLENGVYYKRYVSIYDSLQADNPAATPATPSPGAGIGRNFTTVRFQPHERIEFNANYNYFRDVPTFNLTLVGTTLLDKYLFQGFSGGVRVAVLKNLWVYTTLGKSNRSGDPTSSWNQLYGITAGRIPWVNIHADAHYSKFNSSFGSGYYDSLSLSRSLKDNFRLELLGGVQNFSSQFSKNDNSKFVTSNIEWNVGMHYFMQGGFTVSRGVVQNYDQWLFTLGYRFDTRERAKMQ
jgi:AMIN domain